MNNFFFNLWLSLFLKFNMFFIIIINLLLFLIFIIVTYNNYFLRNSFIFKLNSCLKIFSIFSMFFFFFINLIFFYFSIYLNINKTLVFSTVEYAQISSCLNIHFLSYVFSFNYYGFIIYLLAFLVGFLSILSLDTRVILEKTNFYFFFNFFLIFVYLLTTTTDILLFFFFYELLLIPSFFFVFYISYTKKAIQASLYFVIWTQLGSLLVLIATLFVFFLVNSTNFFIINTYNFTVNQAYVVYTLLFLGFGFKIPIWPFHYWLTKTHVEAPSGFSIYLSGFLVKSALFGFYKLTSLVHTEINTVFFSTLAFIGVLDSSLKMWGQSDLKKLVAYCTVQEMNLIFFLFLLGDSGVLNIGVLFTFTHAFLSVLMFFLVDCLYRRYHSRSIFVVNGVINDAPNLGIAIISMVVFFSGLPGTVKFVCEFFIFSLLSQFSWLFCFFFMLCINFIGLVGFSKSWFNSVFMLPGSRANSNIIDLTKKEVLIILFCFLMLFLSTYSLSFFF